MSGFLRCVRIPLLIALFFVGGFVFVHADWKKETETIGRVFELLETKYLYDIDLTKCRYDILKALSRESLPPEDKEGDSVEEGEETAAQKEFICLDQYSGFRTPLEARESAIRMRGQFVGIGIRIFTNEKGRVAVMSLIEGGPAEGAGIMAGDVLLRSRNEDQREFNEIKDTRDAVKKIRGLLGSKVFIVIARDGEEIELTPIIRDDIKFKSVEYKSHEDIGYIRIMNFNKRTGDEFEEALRAFRSQGDPPRVVVDLRNNPGGLLQGVIESLYYFSNDPDDRMLTVRYKDSEEVYTIRYPFDSYTDPDTGEKVPYGGFLYPETDEPKFPGEYRHYKVVVLINKGSASAAEIFAGTMKDWGEKYDNFTVVGERSFGKGVGQTVFPLLDGSLISLTTFEYLTGNAKTVVNKKGVTPNYLVEDTRKLPKDTLTERDQQFQKALSVLRAM